MRLVVIGGVAAGMSAAAKAARTAALMQIDVYTDEQYISYSACSLPYYIKGAVARDDLIARTPEQMLEQGVHVHTGCRALQIEPEHKRVLIAMQDGVQSWESYDKLVIATGARPIVPRIPGIELKGVFALKQIPDADYIRAFLEAEKPKKAVVVGGGFIGLEMTETLLSYSCDVTIVEKAGQILNTFDTDIANLAAEYLRSEGITIVTGDGVMAFSGKDRVERVITEHGSFDADIVVLALGVRPNSELAEAAGIELTVAKAIAVDDRMRTNLDDIYAAGDCTAAKHIVDGSDAFIPLGTTANKGGKTAGENAAGGNAEFSGIAGTSIFKILERESARTGFGKLEAERSGMRTWETVVNSRTKAHGYPGIGPAVVKLRFEEGSNRLVGAQIFGAAGAAKRIDMLAAAIQMQWGPEEIAKVDMAYAPPFSPVWDPVLIAAGNAVTAMKKRQK